MSDLSEKAFNHRLGKLYGPYSALNPLTKPLVDALVDDALWASEQPVAPKAKYAPPLGRIIHGCGQFLNEESALAAAINDPALAPASRLSFVQLSLTPPLEGAALFEGVVTHLSLGLFQTEGAGLDIEVATTTKHDARLQSIALQVRDHGEPVMLRIGFEFNGSWNGYHVSHFAAAYRKVADIFRNLGVTNAAFVWSYYPCAPDIDLSLWYPGDDCVDWCSLDVFHRGDFASIGWSGNWQRSEQFLAFARAHNKPVFLSECGSIDVPMAQAQWGDWFGPFFAFLDAHPEIAGFNLISMDWTHTSYNKLPQPWQDGSLPHNPALVAAYKAEISKPKYLHAGEIWLLA